MTEEKIKAALKSIQKVGYSKDNLGELVYLSLNGAVTAFRGNVVYTQFMPPNPNKYFNTQTTNQTAKMDVIRALFYLSSIYAIKVGSLRDFSLFDIDLMGDFPKEYAQSDDFPFAQYGEKDGKIFWIYQAFGSHIDNDIAWLKAHPRPAHREVFPQGEIIDEANGYKVVKVLKNVTLLDMLEALKEFLPPKNKREEILPGGADPKLKKIK